MKEFVPKEYQVHLQPSIEIPGKFESMKQDVVFVGGGPAGFSGAITLARLVRDAKNKGELEKDIEIAVIEKASELGGHNLSGAVLNPTSLKKIFSEEEIKPLFKNQIRNEKVYYLTKEKAFRLPPPPFMKNKGLFTISICELVRFLGGKAEELGVNLLYPFSVESLLMEGDEVLGVRTAASGMDRDGNEGSQHSPPVEILSSLTVLSEGVRGHLSLSYLKSQKISSFQKQKYALGVKEFWEVKNPPKDIIHTLGWPLDFKDFGGSFFYPMGENHLSLGLVVGLDFESSRLDVHALLQKFKTHPKIAPYLKEGKLLEWGAKTIPEGGYQSLPERFHGKGVLICGDALGLVNVPSLKGIHYAIESGIKAGEAAFEALKKNDFSKKTLKTYDEKIKKSYVYKDLYKVRNIKPFFQSGVFLGGIYTALNILTGGLFPFKTLRLKEDSLKKKKVTKPLPEPSFTKVDAVYHSQNKTRDDIPRHLKISPQLPKQVEEFYTSLCPAGVYERKNDKFIINSPNCVDCKATDILGPRWTPREGGSGPNYKKM